MATAVADLGDSADLTVAARSRARRAADTRPAVLIAAAAGVALLLALRLPVATTVLGLAAFGILHNVLELRYVARRYAGVLAGRFLGLLVALVTGVMLCRALPVGTGPRAAEIVLGYVLLAVAWWWARAALPGAVVVLGAIVLTLATAASLVFAGYHFVVLAHLHNVVPLVFLWEWSRGRPGRTAFRAVNTAWVLVVPALLLAGAFDGALRSTGTDLGAFGTFGTDRVGRAYTPPAVLESAMALRFLAVFAFMQTMHYVVWVWFVPRHGASPAVDARLPWLRGGRAWLFGMAGAAALAVVFAHDYATGKTLYAAVASYHAYLEFPVVLALLLGLAVTKESTRAHR